MSRLRSVALAVVVVAALSACSANKATSSLTTGKSTASASVSPQPVAAPSTTAEPMIPAPSGSAAGYPTRTVRFRTGQATVHLNGGTADGKTLSPMSFTAALDTSSTDSFNPKSGEFQLRWVDQNGHGLEVDGTAPRHGNIDAFVRIEVNPAAFTDSFHTQCTTKLHPSSTSVTGQFTCDELPNFAGKGNISGATGTFTAAG